MATEFAPAYSWGGPVFSLLRLAKELGANNHVVVFASTRLEPGSHQKISKAMERETFEGVAEIVRYDHVPLIGLNINALAQLRRLITRCDLIYINSTYSPVVLLATSLCVGKGRKVVWAPRGAVQARLQDSRRSTSAKILFEKILGWLLARCDAMIHLTSEMEGEYLPLPLANLKNFVFPNIVFSPITQRREIKKIQEIRFLFLSRIHEKKGIFELLENSSLSQETKLTLVGPGELADIARLESLIANRPGTQYLGAVYDEKKKSELLTSHDILILPSRSENFGNVVIEALNYRLPVLTTIMVPIDEIDEYGVGKRVANVDDFVQLMNEQTYAELIHYQDGFDRRASQQHPALAPFLNSIIDG